ncbi:MAG: hypothetical protein KF847_17220 [Pirellulales bacterium]|nr:hypothetical protein [Pirellulales bacterium]
MDLTAIRTAIVATILATGLSATGSAAEVQLLPLVQGHFDVYLQHGLDRYGPLHTPLWMASLDTNTKNYPSSDYAAAGKRIYRENPAPKGSTLYFDIPQINAALALSTVTGDSKYYDAANLYAATYLAPSNGRDGSRISRSGLWKWGEHWFYRAFDSPTDAVNDYYNDRYMGFSGSYHEMRPYTPNWDFFWALDPDMTKTQIDLAGEHHVQDGYDTTTGFFSRHDTFTDSPHAFIDAGGVLVESLTWLARRVPEAEKQKYLDHAKKIATYSYTARGATTGLVRNNMPNTSRWDYKVSTTEIGEWAGKLLIAAEYSGDQDYVTMARDGVHAYLQYAWHEPTERYWGKVNVNDGSPSFDNSGAPYAPFDYSSPWNVQIPSHDHYLGLAATLIHLHHASEIAFPADVPFLDTHIRRMTRGIMEERPALNAKDGVGSYAEAYGHAIQIMLKAADRLDDPAYRKHAERLAHEAIHVLWTGDMFRTHGGEDRYDAVDGFGYLAEGLMQLGSFRAPANPVTVARYQFTAGATWLQSNDAHPNSVAGNVTLGSGISAAQNGLGNPSDSLAVALSSANTASQAAALASDDYVGFTITPAAGTSLSLSHLTYDLRRSSDSGANDRYFVRSSVDGFANNLAADDLSSDRFETYFISLIGDEFQEIAEPVEFRFYFFDPGGTTAGIAYLDNLVLAAATTLPGDFNGDGQVSSADLNDPANGFRARFGGDLNGSDFLTWQRQFGVALAVTAAADVVPEPASTALTAISVAFVALRALVGGDI